MLLTVAVIGPAHALKGEVRLEIRTDDPRGRLAPGTGLPAFGLSSYGDPYGDRFERDTRVSLFGALVHSRTADLDVRLDLPPVPDSADVSGLAIKVACLRPASGS